MTEQQDIWISSQLKTGRYGNESEVIRDLIRERQIRDSRDLRKPGPSAAYPELNRYLTLFLLRQQKGERPATAHSLCLTSCRLPCGNAISTLPGGSKTYRPSAGQLTCGSPPGRNDPLGHKFPDSVVASRVVSGSKTEKLDSRRPDTENQRSRLDRIPVRPNLPV